MVVTQFAVEPFTCIQDNRTNSTNYKIFIYEFWFKENCGNKWMLPEDVRWNTLLKLIDPITFKIVSDKIYFYR